MSSFGEIMRHSIIMKQNKFITVCGLIFHGPLLKGKVFKHRTSEEIESIDCQICREKIISLRSKVSNMGVRGGRCALIDLDSTGLSTSTPSKGAVSPSEALKHRTPKANSGG
jgi:hypothetical protein